MSPALIGPGAAVHAPDAPQWSGSVFGLTQTVPHLTGEVGGQLREQTGLGPSDELQM
jgi:hypothetical protein